MRYDWFLYLIILVGCSSTPPLKSPESQHHGNLRFGTPNTFSTPGQHEAYGKKYAIATQGPYSTQAGIEILKLGGNLADAAVAISFTIGVERPQSTGIGGGGFLLYGQKGKKPLALNFRETAPLVTYPKMYLDADGNVIPNLSLNGARANAVPGLVAGVLAFHKRYGKLPLSQVMAPAIRLCEEGFKVYPHMAKFLKFQEEVLRKDPEAVKIFFKDDKPLALGETLVQKDMANTLRLIAKEGSGAFYNGTIARAIVDSQKKSGGLISLMDLRSYKPKWVKPVEGTYKNKQIYSMAPPSSGGIHIIEILNMVEKDPLPTLGPLSTPSVHLLAQAMQRVFVDRAKYLGDADFVKVPVKGLTSKDYAEDLRKKFQSGRALTKEEVVNLDPWKYEKQRINADSKGPKSIREIEHTETTHFSLMDDQGNAIVSTQTVNNYFGSGVVVPGTGIVMNNTMDDFAASVGASNLFGAIGGEKNLIAPKKRALSSMSPTLVYEKGVPIIALGSPSGTRILTCVAQVILNQIDYNLGLKDAVGLVRFHHQWSPDQIQVDTPGFRPEVTTELESLGYKVKVDDLRCDVQAVAREAGKLHAVSDPRGSGVSLAE